LNKHINFEVESADIIEENPNSQFATARILAFSSSLNRHDMSCSEEVLKNTASTIYNKPVLYVYDARFDDLSSHADKPEKSSIAGFVEPNSAEFIREENGGRLQLVVLTKIWKRYAPKVVELFRFSGGRKKVSVEMELIEAKERPDGILEMLNFAYTGVCILGDLVTEASMGAHMQMLSFSEADKEYLEAYKAEFSSRYDDIDFTIPEEVKSNTKMGLDLHKKKGTGATSVALANARFISGKDKITPDKLRHTAKYLSRKSKEDHNDQDSNSYVSWMLYGGDAGYRWASSLVAKMDELDQQRVNYFAKEEKNMDEKEKEELKKEEEMSAVASAVTPMAAEETPETPKEEPKKESEEEEKPKEFSLDAYLDVAAALAFLEAETESNEEMVGMAVSELKKEEGKEFAKVAGAMFAVAMKYASKAKEFECKMSEFSAKMAENEEKMNSYMAENENLKKFKADVEASQFQFEVETTLKEVENAVEMPKEEMAALREKAAEFSLLTLDAYKNMVRAKAFTFAAKGKSSNEVRIGLPFTNVDKPTKKSLWE